MKNLSRVLLFLIAFIISKLNLYSTSLNPSQTVYTTSITYTWNLIGANSYIFQLSTNNFVSILKSSNLLSNSTTFIDLTGNTSYYFRVKISTESDSQYISNTLSTVTLTAIADNPNIIRNMYINDTKAKIILTYTSYNANDTLHQIDVSTDSNFFINISTSYFITGLPPYEIEELQTNTTYYFRIKPIDRKGRPTLFSTIISTQTVAKLPDLLEIKVYITSITINWTPVNGLNENGSNGYSILITDEYDNVVFQTQISNPNISFQNIIDLSTNTFYKVNFSVLNSINVENKERYSITTLSPFVQNLNLVNISSFSAKFSWTPISPSTHTSGYILQASSSSLFTNYISSITYNPIQTQLEIIGLYPNTTYYFRVGSLNSDNMPNYSTTIDTMTLTMPLDKTVINYITYPFSIKATYELRPASTSPWGTYGYIFEVSTTSFNGGIIYSSYTSSNYINNLTISNLRPNLTYFMRVGTINGKGAINYSEIESRTTPFPNIQIHPYVSSYSSTTITISYSTADTDGYVVEVSTEEGFLQIDKTTSTTNNQQNQLTLYNLNTDSLYHIRVGAVFSESTNYFYITQPIRTLTEPPTVSNFKIYITSAHASWSEIYNSNGYFFEASTSPYFNPKIFSYTKYHQITNLDITGLIPNTTYHFRIGSINSSSESNYNFIIETSTLANFPIETPLSKHTTYSMQINYNPNSNPPDTLYLVEISSTNFIDHPLSTKSSWTYNSYAYFNELQSNTTYYKRITIYNRHMIPTGPVYFTPVATLAYKISNLTHITSTRTIILNWQDTSNAIGTPYLAEISSNGFITIISSYTLSKSATFYNLNGNTIYSARVSALNFSSIPSEYEVLKTTTRVEIPSIVNPTYINILLDGFSAQWDNNSNSTHTLYIIESSTHSDFSFLFRTNQTYQTSIVFGNLNFGTRYYVRIKARGINNEESEYLDLGSVETLYRAEKIINHTIQNILSIPFSYGSIEVIIPPYSLGSATRLFIEPISSIPQALSNAANLNHTGYAARVYIIPKVLFTGPITIKIPYSTLPPSVNPNNLVLARYDEEKNLWVPLRSHKTSNYIIGETYGFSIFAIMELIAANNIDNIKIYPNPYKPNTTPGYLTFSNLPPNTQIYIHSLSGELIKKLTTNNCGMVQWDGKNTNGKDISSGIYIVVIVSPDGKKVIKKIGIER
ncbi:MAG: T9SS type A sorting domain-containing protein [Elusimicrobiales bacterium]|nr:T9SS type A sorting domain-containing protein [Elusimicrobiales bacterium]